MANITVIAQKSHVLHRGIKTVKSAVAQVWDRQPVALFLIGKEAMTVHQKLYEGSRLTRVTLGLMYFRISKTGTLKTISLYVGADILIGSAIFNVRIGGVSQFAGASRFIFDSSNPNTVTKTGLSIAVTKGGIVVIDLEDPGTSGVTGPVTAIFDVE